MVYKFHLYTWIHFKLNKNLNLNLKFQVTRNVLSAFRRSGFVNPITEARKAINVVLMVNVCPQLQAELSLSKPRPIAKRRQSTAFGLFKRKMKMRRLSCIVTGNLNDLT